MRKKKKKINKRKKMYIIAMAGQQINESADPIIGVFDSFKLANDAKDQIVRDFPEIYSSCNNPDCECSRGFILIGVIERELNGLYVPEAMNQNERK